MNKVFTLLITLTIFSCGSEKKDENQVTNQEKKVINKEETKAHKNRETKKIDNMKGKTLYDFKAKSIDGNDFDFNSLKGKKVLIVNTASECGLTPQFEQLEEIYQAYKDSNFTIVGFPANNFGSQEPLSNSEIVTFCKKNFGVSFQMMEKISVLDKDVHPLYQWLVFNQREKSGDVEFNVQWNFHKFLIDEEGNFVGEVSPSILPNDEVITNWINS